MGKIEKLDLNMEVLQNYAKLGAIPPVVILQAIGELSLKINEIIDKLALLQEKKI